MAVVLKQIEQAAAVTLMTTELNALANNAGATSSVGGTAGVFANIVGTANMDGNSRGKIEFKMGGTVTTLTAGGSIKVWFLKSVTGYESGTPPVRNPDVVIPLDALTVAQTVTRECNFPVGNFKLYAQNSATGQAMPATGNVLSALLNTDEGV